MLGVLALTLFLLLSLQETWQEVCLLLDRDVDKGTATSVVLNRPMAFQLTEHLAQLVLYGSFRETNKKTTKEHSIPMDKFMKAFGRECAIYVGGPVGQHKRAIVLHGHGELEGSVEVSPGTGIYRGGLAAAVEAIIEKEYSPLDFRFFVGTHEYENQELDLEIMLGKHQPIACARSVALKQCISLPKPLWHEGMPVSETQFGCVCTRFLILALSRAVVMELSGDEMAQISKLDQAKWHDTVTTKIEYELEDDPLTNFVEIEVGDEFDVEIANELSELDNWEDDEDYEDDDDDEDFSSSSA